MHPITLEGAMFVPSRPARAPGSVTVTTPRVARVAGTTPQGKPYADHCRLTSPR